MLSNIASVIIPLGVGYFIGTYQSKRTRILKVRQFITRLKAELADLNDERLIEFFLSYKNSVRDTCSIHSIDVPFWNRKKFITTYTQFLNLQPDSIIDDPIGKVISQKEGRNIYTPDAKFPGRERMNDLLSNLDRLAG